MVLLVVAFVSKDLGKGLLQCSSSKNRSGIGNIGVPLDRHRSPFLVKHYKCRLFATIDARRQYDTSYTSGFQTSHGFTTVSDPCALIINLAISVLLKIGFEQGPKAGLPCCTASRTRTWCCYGLGRHHVELHGSTVGGIVFDLRVVRVDRREMEWQTSIIRALTVLL